MPSLELVRSAVRQLPTLARSREPTEPTGCGLSFTAPGGPVVVVAGLHGGAGTSTLAYALAAQAAQESPAPILLAEADQVSGDIAHITGTASPLSLGELALELAAGRQPQGGTQVGRLRVIARPPSVTPHVSMEAVVETVRMAQGLHGLIVIDAGTVRSPGARELMLAATHVLWVMTSGPGVADRARSVLASGMIPTLTAEKALVVRGGPKRGRAVRELCQLAGDCCDTLLMIGDSPGINGHVDLGERRVVSALTGLGGFLN